MDNRTVAETYDRYAAAYDRLMSPLERGTRERALDTLGPEPGARVLDVGAGPGHALVALGERVGPAGSVIGLDAAPAMVERARSRADRSPVGDRVAVLLGDARSLPLADASVDAVFLEDTLELFNPADRRTVLGEVHRVLHADGRMGDVTMERAGAERSPFVRAFDLAFEHVPGVRRFGCRPIRAREALEAAGFAVQGSERHRRALVWPVDVLVATLA